MQEVAVIIGGSGYIGKFLIRSLLASGKYARIYNLDLKPSGIMDSRLVERYSDIRNPMQAEVEGFDGNRDWIIYLAALCREPGSEPREYFDTNMVGTGNVISFAECLNAQRIFFTSTMSTYGRAAEPTPESTPQYAETPYGISKLVAEKMHLAWLAADKSRRLIICRPSVIFGPNDVGNILRMIKAIGKGYFFFPGDPGIHKAYGYIHGLIESFHFAMDRIGEPVITYNYAEWPQHDLRGMVETIKSVTGKRAFTMKLPLPLLVGISHLIQFLMGLIGKSSPIHPVRVRKVASPTFIKPQYLLNAGFAFKYPLERALEHWRAEAPADFEK